MLIKNKKSKVMQLFKYELPWQPNLQIVSDFTKKEHIESKISPFNKGTNLIIYARIM